MLKLLFSPKRAERHPFEMMLIAIVYSTIAIWLAYFIFPQYSSIVMVFFTVLSCIYVLQGAFKREELKEKKNVQEEKLLRSHAKLLVLMLFLFIGFVISFSIWSFVMPSILPTDQVSVIFSSQGSAVDSVRAAVSGVSESGAAISGSAVSGNGLGAIITNNLKVLFISLLLAFFFGAGAIFVLAWNASVMGYVIGNLARDTLGLIGMPIAFAKYFVHGIPEMLAYLTAALAGGIIYMAICRGDFLKLKRNKRIIFDVIVLILIAIFLLIVAALIEVYVSPFI
jgi:uncharacterized membrane protein SpoIIM required for sporulation